METLDISKFFEVDRGFRDRNYHSYDSLEDALTEKVLKIDVKRKIEQYYRLEEQINGLKKPINTPVTDNYSDFAYSLNSRKRIPVAQNERNYHQLTKEELMQILKLDELDSIESLFEPINTNQLIEDYLQNFFINKKDAIELVRAKNIYASKPIYINEQDMTQQIIDISKQMRQKKLDDKAVLKDIFKIEDVNRFIITHFSNPLIIYSLNGIESNCRVLTQLNPTLAYDYILILPNTVSYPLCAYDFNKNLGYLNEYYIIHLSGFSSVDIFQLKTFDLLEINKKYFYREEQAFNITFSCINKELRGMNAIKSKFIKDSENKIKLISEDWKAEVKKNKNKISEQNSWFNGEVAYLEFLNGTYMIWY